VAVLWLPLAKALNVAGTWHPRSLPAIEGAAGWTSVSVTEADWQPRFTGQRASLLQAFERDGRRVVVHVAYYAGQTDGHEMVNSGNVLVPASDRLWREVVRGRASFAGAPRPIQAKTATIVGPNGGFDVAWWYWIDGRTTASESMAKALQAWSRLTLKPGAAAAVFLFTEATEHADSGEVLRRFATEVGGSIERSLVAAGPRHERLEAGF
jgi:EpsI family protein